MKVLLISSSPHKDESRTFLLAKQVLDGMGSKDIYPEIIHLEGATLSFCKHCELCHKKILHCSLKDDVACILGKMLEADGIILASPNYINHVTASMKALLDRSGHFIHCKRLEGKYVVGVVTSGSGQDQKVLDFIKFYAHVCGAQYSGGISALRRFGADKVDEAKRLGGVFADDIRENKSYSDQMKVLEAEKRHFAKIVCQRKDDWQEEYEYWKNKGWL